MSTLKQRMSELTPARRRQVEARAAELIAEEKARQKRRRARKRATAAARKY
jgi:hypothetical protein